MLSDILNYIPPDPKIWQGRADSLPNERFFQQVELIDLRSQELKPAEKNEIVLLGFQCDEGIKRNEGRIGARLGPIALRQQLGKLASHVPHKLFDIGDIICLDENLDESQNNLSKLITQVHDKKYKTIIFGGGHELAFAHFSGLIPHYNNLGIINFDAHFDLRPLKNTQATSGTPFTQIANYCLEKKSNFNYCCLGIQKNGNSASLFNRAEAFHVSYLTAEQLVAEPLESQFKFIDNFAHSLEYIYITICLDVFSEGFAPGVSAPQPLGLTPWQVLPLLKYILQTGKVISLDIAELSPPLDCDQKTARLAASILAELLDLFRNSLQRKECEETRSTEPECTSKYMGIRAPYRRNNSPLK